MPLCVRPVRHDVEELALEADVGAAATDKMTGNGRGFGFVTFDGPGPVDDIMQRRDHSIGAQRLSVHNTGDGSAPPAAAPCLWLTLRVPESKNGWLRWRKVFYGTTSGPLQGCRGLWVPEVSTARTGPGLPRGHTAAERRGISGDLRKTFFSAYCSDEKVLLYGAGCEPAVPTWG